MKFIALSILVLLAACGGGDPDDDPKPLNCSERPEVCK